jgi:hypothetical protein
VSPFASREIDRSSFSEGKAKDCWKDQEEGIERWDREMEMRWIAPEAAGNDEEGRDVEADPLRRLRLLRQRGQ